MCTPLPDYCVVRGGKFINKVLYLENQREYYRKYKHIEANGNLIKNTRLIWTFARFKKYEILWRYTTYEVGDVCIGSGHVYWCKTNSKYQNIIV